MGVLSCAQSVRRDGDQYLCAKCGEAIGTVRDGLWSLARVLETALPMEVPNLAVDSSEYVDCKISFRRVLCRGCGICVYTCAGASGEKLPGSFVEVSGPHGRGGEQ